MGVNPQHHGPAPTVMGKGPQAPTPARLTKAAHPVEALTLEAPDDLPVGKAALVLAIVAVSAAPATLPNSRSG